MLEVRDLQVNYGAIEAVKGISFDVAERELIALIGANGAGKTTTLRTISGILRPRTGSIRFQGHDLAREPTHKIVAAGVVQAPEVVDRAGDAGGERRLWLGCTDDALVGRRVEA